MSTEKIYCVYIHTCPDGSKYFGMSKNVKARWKPSQYKGCSLEPYIEQFGWGAITHQVVANGLTRDEALKLEDELICKARENGTCINMFRSGHYKQTDEFKEKEKTRKKAWNEAHPEECKARKKAWDEAHPEECKAYHKAYYKSWWETHKDEQNARKREWRKRKKAEKQAQQSNADNTKSATPKQKHKKQLF